MRAARFRFAVTGSSATGSPSDSPREVEVSGFPSADVSAAILGPSIGGDTMVRRRRAVHWRGPWPVQRLYSTPETLTEHGLFGGPCSGRQMLLGLTIRMLAAALIARPHLPREAPRAHALDGARAGAAGGRAGQRRCDGDPATTPG